MIYPWQHKEPKTAFTQTWSTCLNRCPRYPHWCQRHAMPCCGIGTAQKQGKTLERSTYRYSNNKCNNCTKEMEMMSWWEGIWTPIPILDAERGSARTQKIRFALDRRNICCGLNWTAGFWIGILDDGLCSLWTLRCRGRSQGSGNICCGHLLDR